MPGTDGFIQTVPDSTGKKLRTFTVAVAGIGDTEQEVIVLADENGTLILPLQASDLNLDGTKDLQVDVKSMPSVTVTAANLDIRDLLSSQDSVAVEELNPTGLKVDITTDTLGGLKVLEKNAGGVKVDLVTDTLAGLKVLEKNAGGVKVDLVTDTLGGLKVLEKNATGVKVDVVTDTLGGLKVVEKNATGVKVDLVTDTLAGLKTIPQPNTASFKRARIDCTVNGDNEIVAAVGGKVIKVYAYTLQAKGTVTATFCSDAGSGTPIGPEWTFQAREGAVVPQAITAWFQTAQGKNLNLLLDAAVVVTGNVIYTDSDAS